MTEGLRGRPRASSAAEKEMDKIEKQFDSYENQIKDLTLDRMNSAAIQEVEPQTKISQKDLEKSKDVYLKPDRSIACRAKFNEDYRKDYEFSREYVQFIAENKEIIGETIELWTKPFAGVPAEFWRVPTNKPVWAPRYVAERIKGCTYHRMSMSNHMTTGSDGMGQYYGQMVVDNTIQRLDAHPVNQRKSVFMGASGF